MNKLLEVKLKYINDKPYLIDFSNTDKIIAEPKQLGCIAELKHFSGFSHKINQKFREMTSEDFEKILKQGGKCFIETEEMRHMALTWDTPINSYSKDEPLYYDVVRLIDGKAIIYV